MFFSSHPLTFPINRILILTHPTILSLSIFMVLVWISTHHNSFLPQVCSMPFVYLFFICILFFYFILPYIANFLVYLFFIVFLPIIFIADIFSLKVMIFLFIFICDLLYCYKFFVLKLLFNFIGHQFPMSYVTFIDLLFDIFMIIFYDIIF